MLHKQCSCRRAFSLICIIFACIQMTLCILCGDVHLYGPAGTIQSPLYPNMYPNNTNCMWRIHSSGESIITIRVQDLDIEPDEGIVCGFSKIPCCRHNWLSLPSPGSGRMHQEYCGRKAEIKVIKITANDATIKFHTSKIVYGGKGFLIRYSIDEYDSCKPTEFQCSGGQCVPDESDCKDPCFRHGKMSCFDGGCFDSKELCDGKQDCLNGRDESDCPTTDTDQSCELKCDTGEMCYTRSQICDGKPDCMDFTDEVDCGYCLKGHALCNADSRNCFKPSVERCDGRFNCPHGEDEVGCVPGCETGIACSSGIGCYTPSERCNSQSDCVDESDEALCPQELCAKLHDKRQCNNGRCLQARLWCDGAVDCSDGSDEDDCVKTSVVAAAIMLSLVCGLLLVIAVGCTFRIYGQRLTSTPNYRLHLSQQLASRLRMHHSVSLPALIDDDYFRREPPPAYSVAVGECLPENDNTSTNVMLNSQNPSQIFLAQSSSQMLDYCPQLQHNRRSRRLLNARSLRNPRTRQQSEMLSNLVDGIKTQNVDTSDSQCEASSSQSSPSRESVTSSSYLSGSDDNTLLLRS